MYPKTNYANRPFYLTLPTPQIPFKVLNCIFHTDVDWFRKTYIGSFWSFFLLFLNDINVTICVRKVQIQIKLQQTNKQIFDNEFVIVHLKNTDLCFFISQLTVAKIISSVGQSSLFFDGTRLTIMVTSFKGHCGRTLKFWVWDSTCRAIPNKSAQIFYMSSSWSSEIKFVFF